MSEYLELSPYGTTVSRVMIQNVSLSSKSFFLHR